MKHPFARTPRFSRRDIMQLAGASLLAAGIWPLGSFVNAGRAVAGSPVNKPAAQTLPPLNRFPRMVQEYFVSRVRQIEAAANDRRAALKTRADAEAYVASVRQNIRTCFGPAPEKTPLNARISGTLKRDGYRIEKVIFESRPQFIVTANLYVPERGAGPMPGVVGACGHSANGKADATYQSFAQALARQGYVVLIYDPLGQGERLQYPNEKLQSRVGVGVHEHLLAGNQQFLVGEFLGAWRAWDGVRALDYLLTRPEVDPSRVGVTGNSGGGTLTTWLCGVDQRWTMAAPSCFVTTFRRNLENELPADTEQCPPGALAMGLDHADFLAALAPKPVIILSQEKDFFDCRGSTEAYERLKKLYTLLGQPDNIALFIGPRPHGYSIENRQAMYRWFNRHAGVGGDGAEPQLALEEPAALACTAHGQVCELQSRTVFSFAQERAQALAASRQPLSLAQLQAAIADVLKLPPRTAAPDYRILRPIGSRQYPAKHATTYAVETEPGIQALVYYLNAESTDSRPPRDLPRAILYVSHQSADAELRDEPLIADLRAAEPQSAFFACDVRGIGESRPDTCGSNSFLEPYGCDYFYAIHSLMLDYPYLGQKTHDLLRVIDWLESTGCREIHVAARGWGALPATFAAVLHPRVGQVTMKHALTSYADVAQTEVYHWPLSSLLLGVLKRFDLPDCYRALGEKKIRMIEPAGA